MRQKKTFDRETFFAALSDRTRLRLLNLMEGGEICVCYFVVALNAPQSKISRHLAYLRRAGIVSVRKEGKWAHYSMAIPPDPHAANILKETRKWLATDAEMQRDRSFLAKLCCATQLPVALQGAPRPTSLL
jgi:ArsR family transcriptional regulator